MNIKYSCFMKMLIAAIFAIPFGIAMGAEDDAVNAEEEESPEIALIRLELEYDCEISEGCREKNDDHLGKQKVTFKSYKEGTATSVAVQGVKGDVEVIDVTPAHLRPNQ